MSISKAKDSKITAQQKVTYNRQGTAGHPHSVILAMPVLLATSVVIIQLFSEKKTRRRHVFPLLVTRFPRGCGADMEKLAGISHNVIFTGVL